MWHDLLQFLQAAVGWREPGAKGLTAAEMAARGAFGFIVLLAMIRIGRRRMMGRTGPFDLVVTLIIGSTLSRGITGNAPLLPTLAACAAIIAVHWTISATAARSAFLGRWIEGKPVELLRNGQLNRVALKQRAISEQDMQEALRLQAKRQDLSEVAVATLERSGTISMVAASPPSPPRVLEVHAEPGVQTVRIVITDGGAYLYRSAEP